MAVSTECIGLAAEYAVASELCRRGIYAQLTFGNKKRTDILLMSENNQFITIEVKAKQGAAWPHCKGIYGSRVLLVFVDYANCSESERPDFYILTSKDWLVLVKERISVIQEKKPDKRIVIDKENVPVFVDEINKYGKPYRGISISSNMVQEHKEDWNKIIKMI